MRWPSCLLIKQCRCQDTIWQLSTLQPVWYPKYRRVLQHLPTSSLQQAWQGPLAPSSHVQTDCKQVAALQRDAAAARADGAAGTQVARLVAAARIADLEAEAGAQRTALGELSAAAGSLAEENTVLGGQLASTQAARRAAQAGISHLEVGACEPPLKRAMADQNAERLLRGCLCAQTLGGRGMKYRC